MNRRQALAAAVAFSLTLGAGTAMAADNVRIALVVKALGVGFFEAARKGGEEAARARSPSCRPHPIRRPFHLGCGRD